ncbi:MAG TPA: hypothetical protein VNT03_15995 [Baekduia sp.]|nr:hypothetical protein [Baekduia sp.]
MPDDLPAEVGSEERAHLARLRPSRIRAVQAGALQWTSVDIIDVSSGGGATMRAPLERFGIGVRLMRVGQARHLVAALGGQADAPFVILDCHGDEGRIVLPELADEVDRHQPLHGSVGPQELRSFARLRPGAVVICTGCDTGTHELAGSFLDNGASAYVAPAGAPFGYASVFAPLLLFYELTERRSLRDAVRRLRQHDQELSMWRLFER